MPERGWKLAAPPRLLTWLLLASVLLVALFLRTYELDRFPPGPFGDEAAATILAAEVANGRSAPIFIQAYTGHEVLFYYLAAPIMRLLGATVWALRLTAALVGVTTVMLAYGLARELFDDESVIESHWLGLFVAALMATAFWHVSVSRYGYRANTLPMMQSLMLLALWRGLRRQSSKWIVAAGVFCGLIAYTYLSSRIVPAALAIVLPMLLIAERKRWRSRLKQLAVVALVALAVFAPLGLFFLTHPDAFATRMTQVSILAEGGAWQPVLVRNVRRALELFTLRGDPQWRFGIPNLPVFQGPLALAFYLGLGVVVVRMLRPSHALDRARYALVIVWPLVMMIPTILSDPVEVPHSLRAIGMLPWIFIVPALGLVAAISLIRRLRAANPRVMTALAAILLAITLGGSAVNTFQNYFVRWGPEPRLYYDNNQDIADMARYLDSLPDDGRSLYVSALDYRHPTVAALSRRYDQIKWMQGNELFVFSPGPATYAWPHFSMPDDFWLARFFPPELRLAQGLGPDGAPAYIVYVRDQPPVISPAHSLSATFGGVIQAIGYDVLRDRPSGGKTDMAVYWRVLRKPDRGDYSEFITMQDAGGMPWAQGGSFAYPSEQWAPGEIIAERVRIQTEDGTPPGSYWLKLGWWSAPTGQRLSALDEQARFAGTTVTIGPITVTQRIRPLDLNAIPISHHLGKDFGGLTLLGFDEWPVSVRQGEPEFVTLYWQARNVPLPDRQVTLQMRGGDQHAMVLSRGGPAHGQYPTSLWTAGEFVADRLALHIPRDAPPGTYTLEAQVDDFPTQPLGQFEVQAIARDWMQPAVSHPMSITLGSQIALSGYDVKRSASNVKPQEVALTLYWQALREMDESYTVFVHLMDGNRVVRAQQDSPPVNGTYPTTLWQPGEFITDLHVISLPPDLPPGDYVLEVGMYLAETGARLAVAGNQDYITLGTVSITR